MRAEASRARSWVGYVIGGLVGAVIGGVVAINVMIYSGVEAGYQAGLAALFDHSVVAGVLAVSALVSGPVVGVLVTRWIRRSG